MAGLGKKTWSPGDVLTSSDVNGYLMEQSVMVFAGTAARASAIPSPSAGMVAYSTATNLQVYHNAAWSNVVSSVTPGLVCVKAETSFTAASTFTADNVFTSTYTHYLMIVNFTTVSGSATLKLRASGTASSASYNYQSLTLSGATVTGALASTQTSFACGAVGNNVIIPIQIYGPQLAAPTSIYVNSHQNPAISNAYQYWGAHNVSTAYDGVEMSFTTGTGTYAIYGYSETV